LWAGSTSRFQNSSTNFVDYNRMPITALIGSVLFENRDNPHNNPDHH
jgi:hypothetical protein